MRIIPFLFVTFLLISIQPQLFSQNKGKIQTRKCAGTYQYGTKPENGPVGTISIFPESDSTVLFYLFVNLGKESFNHGMLIGFLEVSKDSANYFEKHNDAGKDQIYAWSIHFFEDRVVITTQDSFDDCGFGGSVSVDGTFFRTSRKIPKTYLNGDLEKEYFREFAKYRSASNQVH